MNKKSFLKSVVFLTSMFFFSGAWAFAKDPIVFVHGYSGSTVVNFSYMIGRFSSDGYPSNHLKFYDYNSILGVIYGANKLNDKVNQALSATGKSKVDLVAHSMGGLVVRYYMQHLGGASKVDDVVTVASPHQGTIWAYLDIFTQAGKDMRPGSSLLNSINGYYPGLSLWSSCDEIVIPHSSPRVGNYQHAGCWEHNLVMLSSSVYNTTKNYID